MGKMIYRDLEGKEIIVPTNKFLVFLYSNCFGRLILKIMYRKTISKIVGWFLNTRLSKIKVKKYIKNNNIDMSRFDEREYKSFNDFFTRKIKKINKTKNKSDFISNCDCKVSIFDIDSKLILNVKNTKYSIKELIKDEELAKKFKNGKCIVYRLEPSDYHRYIFIDDGKVISHKRIEGRLHTVSPIVYDYYEVFTENTREVSVLDTNNFSNIVQIEVGALCVGKIVNHDIDSYKRYDEKGYFEFGGSTIIHLVEKDKIVFDERIISNTKEGVETIVHIGDVIGKRK